ncbi:hypothetical protein PFICI_03734 [Pestalotiopsis fici W106-1]|uniref:Zn(2)-C6 fungal-type domain-containing protein n=1 Tax=Pestalotiopsis fici (strain W106-1 / CGMCC3.15140) TaxID=1229662 RepID=W3XI81_PESFW|nr:uncharacterized protein PFICI_03734 [Pestalotiopsis fici W106-1]ETS85709.1 hypothetical protein PFICI_03734 [Pestalotiopsis fici W106-1]
MVGVAGRSKACATCKSRHIRCDERRPTCYRCEKTGYTCQGYDRPLIFIDGVPKNARAKSIASRVLTAQRQDSTLTISTAARSAQHQGPAFQQAENFIHQLLLAQGVHVDSHHHGQAPDREHHLLHVSTEAATLLLRGRLTRHAQTVYQATKLSGMALEQLRAMLAQHNSVHGSANNVPLLAIIMNMTVFELLAATTRDSCKHHVRGLAALIESCGPAVFREPSMRLILGQARAHIMVLHMEGEHRTFLEQPCWQEVPWDEDPGSKSLTARYMDIICCIPGLLEDQQRLLEIQQNSTIIADDTCDPRADDLRSSMRAKIVSLYIKLLDIRWQWELDHPNCCHDLPVAGRSGAARNQHCAVPLPVNSETGRPIYGSVLFFNDLYRAVEMNFYHTCLLILHSLARSLDIMQELEHLHTPPPCSSYEASIPQDAGRSKSGDATRRFCFKTNVPLLFPHESQSDYYAVHDICRTVDFLLHPNYGHAGALFLIFPLRVAQVYSTILPFEREDTSLDITRSSSDQNVCHGRNQAATQSINAGQNGIDNKAKIDEHKSLSVWMRKIMRHVGDVYGFGIAYGYT